MRILSLAFFAIREVAVSRWGSFIALAAIVVVFAFLFYTVMAQFLLPIFIALVLVVICKPLHRRVMARVGNRTAVAAAITTTIVLCAFLVPIGFLSSLAIVEAVGLADKLSQPETLYELQEMRNRIGLELPPKDAEIARLRIKSKLDELEDAVLAVQGGDGSEKSKEELHRILDYTYRQMGKLVQELEKGRQADIAHRIWRPDQPWTHRRLEAMKQLGELATEVRELETQIRVKTPTVIETPVVEEPPTRVPAPGGDPTVVVEAKELTTLRSRVDELEAELAILRARLTDVPKKTEPVEPKPENPGGEDEGADAKPPQPNQNAGNAPFLAFQPGAAKEPADDAAKADAAQSDGKSEKSEGGTSDSHLSPDLVRELSMLPGKFAAFEQLLLGPSWLYGVKHVANPDEALVASGIKSVQAWLFPVAGSAAGMAGGLGLGLFVMTVALYYFLADGKAMIEAILHFSPLDDAHEDALLTQFEQISRAVVVATVATAVVQGLLGGIGYWAFGLKNYFLLTMVTIVTSMIPFVGASLVWGGGAIYLAFTGHPYEAVGLASYGFVIVSTVDNFVKPAILHGQSNLHPLLALLSVLGGVTALGPIGLFVGPMAVAFLQALLKIMHSELLSLNRDLAKGTPALVAAEATALVDAGGIGASQIDLRSNGEEASPPASGAASAPVAAQHTGSSGHAGGKKRKGRR
jgi:predicted PurR-regulated permease PerM